MADEPHVIGKDLAQRASERAIDALKDSLLAARAVCPAAATPCAIMFAGQMVAAAAGIVLSDALAKAGAGRPTREDLKLAQLAILSRLKEVIEGEPSNAET